MTKNITGKLMLTIITSVLPLVAQAADVAKPVHKAPLAYIIPPYNWTGFYVGLNGGYMWGSSEWSGSAGNFEVAPKGFIGGGTFGYNFQSGAWVFGIEGDIDYVNAKGTASSPSCSSCTFKDTWLGTFRGRIGYAADRWLPYLTAGGAWGNLYMASAGGSASQTKGGWAIGGGVEYAIDRAWTAKLEYLYIDLGDATCGTAACALPSDQKVHFTSSVLRAGINYRF